MKVIYSLVCFFLLLVLACANEPSASTENNNTPVTVVAPETPVESSSAKERSSVIEKEPAPNVEVAPINYITLADAYCKCAAHTVSINEKLKQLNNSNDTAAFEAMLPEADKAFKDAMECCRDAKFHQSTGAVDQKKLFKPLKETCPDLPNQLMLKMVTEIK